MPENPIAAVLFDLDGTLADSIGLILSCYRHTMTTHLGSAPPDAEWIRGMGTPLRVQLAAFASSPEQVEAMVETYVTLQRQIHDEMVRAYDGIPELLAALEAASVPMALVTSRRIEMTRRTLARCDFTRHFDVIVTPDEVTHPKPHPESVLLALEQLGAPPPERTLFVGDSPHDIEAGRAAGVKTVAALWGPFEREIVLAAGPEYAIESPLELLEIRP
ncbi:MAG TPA: HAD-IA family hydrolase [Longimicrobiales bacterium]